MYRMTDDGAASTSALTSAAMRQRMRIRIAALVILVGQLLSPGSAKADQGGISFWLPGAFGSLAAVPAQPGWSYGLIYYHSSLSAGADVATSRVIRFGNLTTNLTINLDVSLDGRADFGLFAPGYTFETPVLGGRFTLNFLFVGGRSWANVNANITGALGPIGFAAARSVSDSLTAFGDVFVQPMLRWNNGVHNYMVYGMWNFPIGSYDAHRLVNLGLGHWAVDGGVGYTYFNPHTGYEFTAVTGLTYNFINPDLDYKNGIDWHLDWAASRFLSKQVHVGVVGYAFQQITGDSGAGATLGDFKSRVFGIGPQIGYIFPAGHMQGYLNVKGYKEFGAEYRPEGWNLWVTLAFSPPTPQPPPPSRPMIHK